ncbi:hypothetical protein LMH87_000275 [Akanthomyces muscarius]|uniref:Mitochondrial carrier protein n=1 Tax=Akanthomyces muscarius TaxID=2231603 RepID=A0A9W8QE77_AKAMU|nr:hypothetical protein LMH87_000275 [Akanthomyces muscarius]KAJ4155009.1 hypothetical protein LMH87_000275 [Akanthomyces muscarius]
MTSNSSPPAKQNAAPAPREKPRQSLTKRYRTEIAASSSSVFSTLVAFPLDSVKTRMQTYQYRGFLDCVKQTYKKESLGGFFRGVTAPMASITLVRTVSFSIYQRAKYAYAGWVKKNTGFDILRHVNKPGNYPNMYSIACFGAAGATAGAVIPILACPFELSKLSSQVAVLLAERGGAKKQSAAIAQSYQNKGTLRTMATIVKHRGVLGLYTGFRLHQLRDTIGTGIYFMVYESGKQLGTTFAGDSSNKLAVVAAGGSCGLISWAIIYPIDSAKSIYQRNSLLYARGEKVEPAPKITFLKRDMYRGLAVSMSRSCVVNAIFFSSFEFIKKHIKDNG